MPWLKGTPREPLTPWLLQPKLLMKWLHSLKHEPQFQVNRTEILPTGKRNQKRKSKAPCVLWFEISRWQAVCWGGVSILLKVIADAWIFKFERPVALWNTHTLFLEFFSIHKNPLWWSADLAMLQIQPLANHDSLWICTSWQEQYSTLPIN